MGNHQIVYTIYLQYQCTNTEKSSNLTILQNLWKHAGLDLITLQMHFFDSLTSKF